MTAAAAREAYGAAAGPWAAGPHRVYAALAAALVARSPAPLAGCLALDVGAGTGAASEALRARGARPVGVDVAREMLLHERRRRGPAVVGDALALPFADGAAGAAVYAFCLNHLHRPEVALREAARVVAPGGAVLASVFATDREPPQKALLEGVLGEFGWVRPRWHHVLREETAPLLGTAERCAAAARAAGLADVDARVAEVVCGTAGDAVAWRLGMPHTAPFVAGLAPGRRAALVAAATEALAGSPAAARVVLLAARAR